MFLTAIQWLGVNVVTPVFIAWITARSTIRRDKNNRTSELCIELVRDLQSLSTKISQNVVDQLTASGRDSEAQNHAQKITGNEFKLAHGKMQTVWEYLPSGERSQLLNAFLKWKTGLTSEPYPMKDTSRALPHTADAVLQREIFTSEWIGSLETLIRRCITEKIGF